MTVLQRRRGRLATVSTMLACAAFSSGCATATLSIGQLDSTAVKGIKRVAVLDFEGGGAEGAMTGSAVAGIVQTRLTMMPGFEVIEREKFKALLAEHELLAEGVIDEDTVQEFRKSHGIDGIIAGSIIQYGQEQRSRYIFPLGAMPYSQTSVSFNMRVIDTSNAKAVYLCSAENSEENRTYLDTAGKIVDLALEPLRRPNLYSGGQTIRK